MSFWPSIHDKIASQIKLIEYRRVFPKDCTYAYMYISKPVKAICGIVYFTKKHSIYDWKDEYSHSKEILSRINHTLDNGAKYAMEIGAYQKIEPITLDELRENVEDFVAPQSYLLLENNIELSEFIQRKTVKIGKLIENNLSNIFPEHICKRY